MGERGIPAVLKADAAACRPEGGLYGRRLATGGVAPVRELYLRRRRSRLPWVYRVYHRKESGIRYQESGGT